ncbi:MAG: aldehyde dehydrogenase family protein [Solimonas sp.]
MADALAAADAAASAFEAWSATGPNERRSKVHRVLELLAERSAAFVDTMVAETGTSEAWARFNVQGAIDEFTDLRLLTVQPEPQRFPI